MPRKAEDLTGQRFGHLVVVSRSQDRVSPSGRRTVAWLCRCDCGNAATVVAAELKRGKSRACGCMRGKSTKHGGSYTRAYRIYRSMKSRCDNPNSANYSRYGGRGIKVCDRWNDFAMFLSDMGEPPDGYSLDRIDNDGDYTPGNCKWSSPKQQSSNRSVTKRISFQGQEMTLADWARHLGINKQTISARLAKGWPTDKVLSQNLKPK